MMSSAEIRIAPNPLPKSAHPQRSARGRSTRPRWTPRRRPRNVRPDRRPRGLRGGHLYAGPPAEARNSPTFTPPSPSGRRPPSSRHPMNARAHPDRPRPPAAPSRARGRDGVSATRLIFTRPISRPHGAPRPWQTLTARPTVALPFREPHAGRHGIVRPGAPHEPEVTGGVAVREHPLVLALLPSGRRLPTWRESAHGFDPALGGTRARVGLLTSQDDPRQVHGAAMASAVIERVPNPLTRRRKRGAARTCRCCARSSHRHALEHESLASLRVRGGAPGRDTGTACGAIADVDVDHVDAQCAALPVEPL